MTTHLIIGVGNDFRGDDGVGLLVARLLQQEGLPGVTVLESSGEGSALLEAWQGYETVIVVDAARSGATPGAIHQFDGDQDPLPISLSSSLSSHAFGVAGAIQLARQLNRLPPRLTIYAIEAQDFTLGAPITPPVATAAHTLAQDLQHAIANRTVNHSPISQGDSYRPVSSL